MKLRAGFVSNSSASSFVIMKHDLSQAQIDMIKNHDTEARRIVEEKGFKIKKTSYGEICEELFYSLDEPWFINENDDFIMGYTSMTNFSMNDFLHEIGISANDDDIVSWDDGWVFNDNEVPKIHERFIQKKITGLRKLKIEELNKNKR